MTAAVDDVDFSCVDCSIVAWMFAEDGDRIVHEDFYVSHDLWNTVCPDDQCHDVGDGCREGTFVICIGCFEGRLGRRLTHADLTTEPHDLFGTPPSTRFVARWMTGASR